MQHPTDGELRDFVKSHYYCDEDFKEKWEPFEHWDEAAIEDQMDTDVEALKNFLRFFYVWKEEKDDGPENV